MFFSVLWIRIHWFRIQMQIRIHHFKWFWWPKIEKNIGEIFFFLFWSKNAIYLSLGFHKGRQSFRRSHPALQKITFFLGHFCPFGFGSGLRIRIRIQGPHWIRIHNTGFFNCKDFSSFLFSAGILVETGWLAAWVWCLALRPPLQNRNAEAILCKSRAAGPNFAENMQICRISLAFVFAPNRNRQQQWLYRREVFTRDILPFCIFILSFSTKII
jgi:hypothetical protein